MAHFLTMKARLDLELCGRTPSVVTELYLDNCRSYVIEGLTSEFTALRSLSINYVMLQNFKTLPNLPNLEILSAHHNRIARNLHFLTDRCPNLRDIDFSYNRIKFLDEIRPLKKLKSLVELNLECNEINDPKYRKDIFLMLPSLELLSGEERPKGLRASSSFKLEFSDSDD